MKKLPFQVGEEPIPFFLGTNDLHQIAQGILSFGADSIFVVHDREVRRLFGSQFLAAFDGTGNVHTVEVQEGEACKSLSCLEDLASRVLRLGATRRSVLVALGGGAVCNVAGLCAGLLFRGVRFVHVPTTLLAMHDVVTSQKQAVNCGGTKNVLGVYHHPEAIYCDTIFLSTLTNRLVVAGLAEFVKNALLFGGASEKALRSFRTVASCSDHNHWAELITTGVACKCELLQKDPFEKKAGLVFEYGHTVGHTFEVGSDGALNHGEAVVWGMRVAAAVSRHLQLMSPSAAEEHEALLAALHSVSSLPRSLTVEGVLDRILRDNKRGLTACRDGAVPMVLLRRKGNVIRDKEGYPLYPVPMDVLEYSIRTFLIPICFQDDCNYSSRTWIGR